MSTQGTSLDLALARRWMTSQGYPPANVSTLTGDVSPRRYARVALASGGTAILSLYPPDSHDACRRFAATTALLSPLAVRIPAIMAADCDLGLMLLEDLGDQTLFDLRHLSWQDLGPYLESAVSVLARIATLPPAEVARLNPPLDEGRLRRELQQTWELFLLPRSLTGSSDLTRALEEVLETVCIELGRKDPVPCHRDFMARNLVPLPDDSAVAVLDHQDLRLGPPGYDLASLLNDSLFPPSDLVERLLTPGGMTPRSRLAYHRAAVQRTLKAIGTFVAFAQRGSPRHLPLVPPTLERSLHHLRQLPEGRAVADRLAPVWAPVTQDKC